MPKLTRWLIRTSLLYFVGGFLFSGFLVIAQGLGWDLPLGVLLPTYYHVLLVGWVTQLIFGVSLWMFPILSKEKPRGSETLGWLTYACLNSGLLLRIVAEPLVSTVPGLGWVLAASGALQLAAGVSYAANIWARIRPKGG